MEHTHMDAAIRFPVRTPPATAPSRLTPLATAATAVPPAATPAAPEPAAGPVRSLPARHSVRAQILEALRGALASGELKPGEVYSAPVLAERYGVSPTPVREAMQQLASEGAVEAVPNRGFRVAGISARDLAELAEVRAALEVPAVGRLAGAVPEDGIAELRLLAQDAAEAAGYGCRVRYGEADLLFHRALLELSGNRQLVTVATDLFRRAQRPVPGRRPPGTAELLADALEHVALIDALAAGDADTAARLTREHIR
ncbi:GntR family transcriptional regulator [Streptomyces aidingensis]|uniref:DNA-binding transcriptional regulator, GntR family n=1 Tax=Streptomyces aidingensis TaxID=910347 RepID=A0A1I1IYU7_9ACTN|nr:GntR family transcriptional regulator [Streptomyces aidingensis]SFC38853.1 DNA-binding transcriptional regulator, GntR family [Streptomyces aidingensis]